MSNMNVNITSGLSNLDVTIAGSVSHPDLTVSPKETLTLTLTAQLAAPQVFVGPDAPTENYKYLWMQTGLGSDGSGFSLWFNDGA